MAQTAIQLAGDEEFDDDLATLRHRTTGEA